MWTTLVSAAASAAKDGGPKAAPPAGSPGGGGDTIFNAPAPPPVANDRGGVSIDRTTMLGVAGLAIVGILAFTGGNE